MKNTSYIKYITLGAVLALAFFVVAVTPANAQYTYPSGYYGYSYPSGYSGSYAYSYPYQQPYTTLRVSCYPSQTSSYVGNTITWTAYASGGTGSYYYSWSGDESLYGVGQSVTKSYAYAGSKTATVTLTSGNQTAVATCSAVTVNSSSYSYPPVYTSYNYPTLSVYCTANTTSVSTGSTVTWTAYASGQSGQVTYLWSGTDGLSGSSFNAYMSYLNPGQKYGTVTAYSNGQTATANCNNSVNVYANAYYASAPTYYNTASAYSALYQTAAPVQRQSTLQIGCFADPTSASVNQPVTWTAEATGGSAPYTYSWTGSDGISGTQSSVIKYYQSVGSKNAIVTVTSADGKTGVHACSNAVTVHSAGSSYVNRAQPQNQSQTSTQTTTSNSQSSTVSTQTGQQQTPSSPSASNQTTGSTAASIFSLQGVPWGWVAILIIVILFVTVLYLLFNREKV